MSSAYHPQTNGQTKSANKTLENMLQAFINIHQDHWDHLLALAEFAYNNAKQASTTFFPFFLTYRQDPLVCENVFSPPPTNVPSTDEFLMTLSQALITTKNQLSIAQNHQK